jgi:two-component system cell cycle response regulator
LKAQKVMHTLFNKKKVVKNIIDLDDDTLKSDFVNGEFSAYIPTLTFLSGSSIGKEMPLLHGQVTIGRGSDCDIIIPDPSVSRRHLEISCRRAVEKGKASNIKVVLKDLGSKNGTLVNYSSVKKVLLQPGDKIILGRVVLKYEHRDLAEQQFFDEIYRLATIDSATSLYNKATITRILKEEISESARDQRIVSVVLIDIDRFKSLNDIYGHLKGDRILQSVAGAILSTIRRRDKAGRVGGDEFLLVLPETGEAGARRLAERVRKRLEADISVELGLAEPVTASLGVASKLVTDIDPEGLLENADAALYRSKSLGRNRVEVWTSTEDTRSAAVPTE